MLQIVVPFTAPLQTLDVGDLFGAKTHHAATTSPESTITPTMSESSPAATIVSLLAPAATAPAVGVLSTNHLTTQHPLASSRDLLPGPHVQRSVLRL